MDLENAAKSTWTGRLASELGFHTVNRIEKLVLKNELRQIEVWFTS